MPSFALFDDVVIVRTDAATSGWTDFTGLQAVFNFARSQGRPLFFQPGVYDSDTVTVLSSNGDGKPLFVRAIPGSVVLRFIGTDGFLRIGGQRYVYFDGVTFDGQDRILTNNESGRPAFISVVDNAQEIYFENCEIINSTGVGVYVRSANAVISSCNFFNHLVGIWSENGNIKALNNTIANVQNNGIAVWRDAVSGDSSTITGNLINGVAAAAGGSGQNGNGISVFRAIGVTITDNKVFNVKYSAVRCNGGGLCNVGNNNIYSAEEVAIFIEAPGAGVDLTGCIVSNNSVDRAGGGVYVANSGYYNDGISRSVVVEGNRISNITESGNGIVVEQDCVVSGNLIENVGKGGIQAGTNEGARDLVITGNLIRSAQIGVGVSNYAVSASGRSVVVSGNIVRSASVGGIVCCISERAIGSRFRQHREKR